MSDPVFLITGASSGIGAATARGPRRSSCFGRLDVAFANAGFGATG